MPLKGRPDFTIPFLPGARRGWEGRSEARPEAGGTTSSSPLYRGMVLGREADQRMLKLQRQGRLGTFRPSTGQEAASCGPLLAMTERDWMVPAFRELGGMLMRGVPLSRVLMFWGGQEEGNVFRARRTRWPIAVIVGSQIPHAAASPTRLKYRGEKKRRRRHLVRRRRTSQGDFLEGANMAAVWKVPAVFICRTTSGRSARRRQADRLRDESLRKGSPSG